MMGQSRTMSLLETITVSISGLFVMTLSQLYVFSLFGIYLPLRENFSITAIMVGIAMVHRYVFRRVFNWFENPKGTPPTPSSLFAMVAAASREEAAVRRSQG